MSTESARAYNRSHRIPRGLGWLCLVLYLVAALPTSLRGQGLYLIAGTPNNKGGFGCNCDAELFKISSGSLTLIRKLATHESKGLHSVLPDYERGVVFVAAPGEGYPGLEAISMTNPLRVSSKPAVAKDVPDNAWIPYPPSPYPIRIPPGPPTLLSMRLIGSGPDALVQLRFADDLRHADTVYSWSEATGTLVLRPTEASALSGIRIYGAFGIPSSGLGYSDQELVTHAAGRWVIQRDGVFTSLR